MVPLSTTKSFFYSFFKTQKTTMVPLSTTKSFFYSFFKPQKTNIEQSWKSFICTNFYLQMAFISLQIYLLYIRNVKLKESPTCWTCCTCCSCCWKVPLLLLLLLLPPPLELSEVAADEEEPWNWSGSSYLRLATVREMMPGTGPSSCIAFLKVSMAEGLCLPNREMPLMFT